MKEKLFWVDFIEQKLEEKYSQLHQQLDSLEEDLQGETKSSMGDKYETSRARLHTEIDRIKERIVVTENQIAEMNSIDFSKIYEEVKEGAWVQTANASFLISIGLGALKSGVNPVFAISLESPVGKQMKSKKEGEIYKFNGKTFTIQKIL